MAVKPFKQMAFDDISSLFFNPDEFAEEHNVDGKKMLIIVDSMEAERRTRKQFEKLIALYEAAKAENESLRAALQESRAGTETCRNRITELEQQIDTLKLKEAFNPGASSGAAAKEKIDKMIREIDKCISFLEKE